MRLSRSMKLKVLGGLAGILLGLVLSAVWFAAPGPSSPSPGANRVETLSGTDAAGGGAGKLSERAEAFSQIIEVRLRAKEFGKALDLLTQANDLEPGQRDQVYQKAADVVLRPASSAEEDGPKYLEDAGGKAAVGERLPILYKLVHQMPDSPGKVTLLLRVRNIDNFAGLGRGLPADAPRALPAAEDLMDEATTVARVLPARASSWPPWTLGSLATVILGFIGVVLTEMIQEGAKSAAQEFSKQYGLIPFKKSASEKQPVIVAVGTDRLEPVS